MSRVFCGAARTTTIVRSSAALSATGTLRPTVTSMLVFVCLSPPSLPPRGSESLRSGSLVLWPPGEWRMSLDRPARQMKGTGAGKTRAGELGLVLTLPGGFDLRRRKTTFLVKFFTRLLDPVIPLRLGRICRVRFTHKTAGQ